MTKTENDAAHGAVEYTLIALAPDNDKRALVVGEKVAAETGRRVTVRNVDGEVLGIFKPSHSDESYRTIEEYAADLREIMQKLRRKLN
ncbi:hypothetical protein JQ582_37265 [Bradyrhizobium japonicum]|uniref:hypothetical protein n=1 Tax=Bradyrhizobium TaxID=374 RepID=UPI001BA4784A|nr:hypothetical protein [Bradyrhizobium japonicum]MBR0734852.1 hypothetical protein [Bradyrhizobium japonicum]MBR0749586.1 hypothetical protein [Bradyrhizobium japonicum]MBR0808450.1 hypothetical protein [Bradyrhizobium japonicum]